MYVLDGKRLRYDIPFTVGDVTYPANWLRLSTSEQREALGITERPEIVEAYHLLSSDGQLKFVVNGRDEAWEDLEHVVDLFERFGVTYPVWVMPVGATVEDQYKDAGEVANMALARGFNVSARVHAYLWGNAIGV